MKYSTLRELGFVAIGLVIILCLLVMVSGSDFAGSVSSRGYPRAQSQPIIVCDGPLLEDHSSCLRESHRLGSGAIHKDSPDEKPNASLETDTL